MAVAAAKLHPHPCPGDGKTFFLGCGLRARESGRKSAHRLSKPNSASLNPSKGLLRPRHFSRRPTDLDVLPEDIWDSRRSPNYNLERYVKREVLERLTSGSSGYGRD
jgi:hypothetical protein